MPPAIATNQRLIPPDNGVTVRMYRIGHGDCFLLAFAGEEKDKPVYVLIDCGYKPGSPQHIDTKITDITANIRVATGGHIHVAIITHEHQDHVNGISEARFKKITIGQTWLAWTEDPDDAIAKGLREKYKDELLGLLAARRHLAASGDTEQAKRLAAFLEFEFGGEPESFDADSAAALLGVVGGVSLNKKSMRVFKELAANGVKCIRPHEEILSIPGAKGVRVFALGPPRDADQLRDLNPQGVEQFHTLARNVSAGNYFAAAAGAQAGHGEAPFAKRYALGLDSVQRDPTFGDFFKQHYGAVGTPAWYSPLATQPDDEVSDNPDWRRIDKDWLYAAEQLALDMNSYTNNTSLVLAFEIGGKGGKVLLFAADAQRGNWVSWSKKDWKDGAEIVTARDLLARTVLYKVGHHGSHNATLNGSEQDTSPNLAWMAKGDHQREFTAMITAVRAWAVDQKGWNHPLKAIKDALLRKAAGRVFQTDTDFDQMTMPEGGSNADWMRFRSRTVGHKLYFDYQITC